MKKEQVLIVEDDADIRDGVRILLESEGYAVMEAEDGRQGLYCLNDEVDLVILDVMSLVGPRPEIPFHVEHFKEEIPRYLVRQQVRPGLTGWAQINGLRGDTDIAERIRYDIWYIENWTVALDIKILFRTVFGGKMVNDEKIQ